MDDEDLCNMRLVSKVMADIAAHQLFRVIKFHAGAKSYFQLITLSNHKTLCKQVQTLIWDSNLWDLRDIGRFNEFRQYIGWKRSQIRRTNLGRQSLGPKLSSDDLRKHYSWYQYRVEEEWILRQDYEYESSGYPPEHDPVLEGGLMYDCLRNTLPKFTNLKKLSVLNGTFTCANGKAAKTNILCGQTAEGEVISRGERLHYMDFALYRAGVHEFWTSLLAAPKTVTKFRANAVNFMAFMPQGTEFDDLIEYGLFGSLGEDSLKVEAPWQNVTSLHLTITTLNGDDENHNSHAGTQKAFLRRLHALLRSLAKLQSLHLSLERRIHYDNEVSAPIIIRDGIAPRYTWPTLRKLSLGYIDISPDQLKYLILDHATTLEELRLSDICLDTNLDIYNDEMARVDNEEDEANDAGDWKELFTGLRERLRLKRAQFKGCFWSEPELSDQPPRWRMSDNGLGIALSEYLVHGGDNPLTHVNTWNYTGNEMDTGEDDASRDSDEEGEESPYTDEDSDWEEIRQRTDRDAAWNRGFEEYGHS